MNIINEVDNEKKCQEEEKKVVAVKVTPLHTLLVQLGPHRPASGSLVAMSWVPA